MFDWPALTAAFIGGAMGSVHCTAMCGGIAVALSSHAPREQSLATALRLNLGRVLGYALAGAIAGSLGGGIVEWFGSRELQIALRTSIGLVLLAVAARLIGIGGNGFGGGRGGHIFWRHLAPLQRRLVPARTPTRQLLIGALWGWLPCGLSASFLVAAWLTVDPRAAAALMTAFGLGTWVAMLPLTWTGGRFEGFARRPGARYAAATLIATAAVITLAAPWLMQVSWAHTWLKTLGCIVVST
jgi:sulfite exporter TauE/SafE